MNAPVAGCCALVSERFLCSSPGLNPDSHGGTQRLSLTFQASLSMSASHARLCDFPLFLVAVLLSAAGCSTAEYQQANSQCQGEGLKAFPVVQQQQTVRRSRRVEVPDGSTICETQSVKNSDGSAGSSTSASRSVCRPGTRPATEYYDDLVMVDLNQGARDAQVMQCTRNSCLQRFGNEDCKPPKYK